MTPPPILSRTAIRLSYGDVIVVDHLRPMTDEQRAVVEEKGREFYDAILGVDAKWSLVQIGPFTNINDPARLERPKPTRQPITDRDLGDETRAA